MPVRCACRTYPPQVTLSLGPAAPPAAFAAALAQVRDVLSGPLRRGLSLHEVPGPRRIAPWSASFVAEVTRTGEQVASGRFVVLHDPAGQDGWDGDTRVVAFVEAQVEAEMGADPALADVGWSWLLEALEVRGAAHVAAGGTVTRTVSKRFGQIEDPDDTSEVELRASWTVVAVEGRLALDVHLRAWCDLLCCTAGLPPEGVATLRRP